MSSVIYVEDAVKDTIGSTLSSESEGPELKNRERYFCQHCPKIFTLQNNLKRHVRNFHTDGGPRVTYQCHICNRKTKNSYHLETHLKHVHEKNNRVQCELCFKVFSKENSLTSHMRDIHNAGVTPKNLFRCDFCAREFNRKGNLEVHLMYSSCNPHHIIRPKVSCQRCGRLLFQISLRKHKCRKRKKSLNTTVTLKTKPVIDETIKQIKKDNSCVKQEENRKEMCTEGQDHLTLAGVEVGDIGTVRRSKRKRLHIEYQMLNGGETSDSEHEKVKSIRNNDCKRKSKNIKGNMKLKNEDIEIDWICPSPSNWEDVNKVEIKVEEFSEPVVCDSILEDFYNSDAVILEEPTDVKKELL